MNQLQITDEQIRAACRVYGLDPVGYVEVTPFVGRLCPTAGPLGFAAGHWSPGWQFLRKLVDKVSSAIDRGTFAGSDYDETRLSLSVIAEAQARFLTGPQALVAIADLEVNETTEEAHTRIFEGTDLTIDEIAWQLLGYAGFLVCEDIFAEFLAAKKQEA